MARKYSDRAAELGALIQAECGKGCAYKTIGGIVAKMRSYASEAARVELSRCNYPESERTKKLRDNRRARQIAELNQELSELISPRGIVKPENPARMWVTLGGDPRGCCGFLHIDGAGGDGFDESDGFPIY